jgi:hypothetical protein
MTYQDIQDCLDADARTKVRAAIPRFSGKADKVMVQDAMNFYLISLLPQADEPENVYPDDDFRITREDYV